MFFRFIWVERRLIIYTLVMSKSLENWWGIWWSCSLLTSIIDFQRVLAIHQGTFEAVIEVIFGRYEISNQTLHRLRVHQVFGCASNSRILTMILFQPKKLSLFWNWSKPGRNVADSRRYLILILYVITLAKSIKLALRLFRLLEKTLWNLNINAFYEKLAQ